MSARPTNENDGYIYILKNYYIPNVYKVGYTTRDATERAKEISRATGVPGIWEVAREWPVMDAYNTEQYITYVRDSIDKISRESRLLGINDFKKRNKKLVIYILTIVVLVVYLELKSDIGSFLFYGFFAIILFFMVITIIDNNDGIKFLNRQLSKHSLENLPKSLTELRPIMKNLGISHIVSINNIEISMKTEGKNIILETVRKGVIISQKYSCSEKEALIRFILYLKS